MNELNMQLFDSFRKVSAALRRNAPMGAGPRPIPNTQNRILTILNGNDGMTQKQLAYILGIRPQSLGEVVNKMEMTGLIEKKVDENDKRFFNLFLTEKGKERAGNVTFDMEGDSLFNVLSEEEKTQLLSLFNKIIEENGVNMEMMPPREHRHHRPMGPEFGPRPPFGEPMPEGFPEGMPEPPHHPHHRRHRHHEPGEVRHMPFRPMGPMDPTDESKEI